MSDSDTPDQNDPEETELLEESSPQSSDFELAPDELLDTLLIDDDEEDAKIVIENSEEPEPPAISSPQETKPQEFKPSAQGGWAPLDSGKQGDPPHSSVSSKGSQPSPSSDPLFSDDEETRVFTPQTAPLPPQARFQPFQDDDEETKIFTSEGVPVSSSTPQSSDNSHQAFQFDEEETKIFTAQEILAPSPNQKPSQTPSPTPPSSEPPAIVVSSEDKDSEPDISGTLVEPRQWSDERPSIAHLAEQELREDWVARAEWLEEEAKSTEDAEVRARLLVVASELWAMMGDSEQARRIASDAVNAAPDMTIARQQSRSIAASEGDWSTVSSALEAETTLDLTPAERAHGRYLSAEINRLITDDPTNYTNHLTRAEQECSSDVRAPLARLVGQLNRHAAPPDMSWSDPDTFSALADATDDLVRLRGGSATDKQLNIPLVDFENASQMLRSDDRTAAGEAVIRLSKVSGLENAALWLAAAILAPNSAAREKSIKLLQQLIQKMPHPLAYRMLTARALEQGNWQVVANIFDIYFVKTGYRISLYRVRQSRSPSIIRL